MPASFDFDPYDVPLTSRAATIRVFRYNPIGDDGDGFTLLSNVMCERIRHAEGPEPPSAWFRYSLDDAAPPDHSPVDFGRLWPQGTSGPYVVSPDDRLVVTSDDLDGQPRMLFDGFVQSPQIDLTPDNHRVSFQARGVAIRCWDDPIQGRLQRDGDDPRNGRVVAVQLPARFNPDGRPNCTPDECDVDQDQTSIRHPVFLDPDIDRTPDPRSYWTLGKFVRYILRVHNDQAYVKNPDFDQIDALLQSKGPNPGGATIGRGTAADVVIRDYDATNKPWPEVLAAQLDLAGFGMRFITAEDADGSPRSEIEICRKDADAGGPLRDLFLPKAGSDLDPARCNVAALHLRRDTGEIVNAVTVETAQRRIEASFILAPGFEPTPGDEAASQRLRFLRANLAATTGDDHRKYRWYVADESGDGHWDAGSSSWSHSPIDLTALFPNTEDGRPSHVRRMRPGSTTLISRDSQGRPLPVQLALSRDYTGPSPGLWDGTGHWQPITGGWRLLQDRLGIVVIAEDPEAWAIGEYTGSHPQESSRTLRGVTSQARPASPNTRFTLRLTTVVEDDLMLPASVDARPSSPTSFTRRRRVDARDHFALETIAARSVHNPGSSPITARDDTERAVAWARQLRSAHESPSTVGSATLPGLATAYRVGDRIARINGRNAALQTNVGEAQGEAPVFPTIAAVTWDFADDRQATHIELSDSEIG